MEARVDKRYLTAKEKQMLWKNESKAQYLQMTNNAEKTGEKISSLDEFLDAKKWLENRSIKLKKGYSKAQPLSKFIEWERLGLQNDIALFYLALQKLKKQNYEDAIIELSKTYLLSESALGKLELMTLLEIEQMRLSSDNKAMILEIDKKVNALITKMELKYKALINKTEKVYNKKQRIKEMSKD